MQTIIIFSFLYFICSISFLSLLSIESIKKQIPKRYKTLLGISVLIAWPIVLVVYYIIETLLWCYNTMKRYFND